MTTRSPGTPTHSHGFALIAVMWMVAALSILAAGLIHTLRSEIGGTQHLLESTRADASASAAIHLAIRELLREPTSPTVLERRRTLFEAIPVELVIVPAAGLIDLNRAEAPLLEALFRVAGGSDETSSAQLAARIVQRRQEPPPPSGTGAGLADHAAQRRQRQQHLDVIEDLLQIPGVSFDLFVRIRDLVTVGGGHAQVYPSAAPPEVLTVLAAGDALRVARFVEARDAGDPLIDASGFQHRVDAYPGGGAYRVDAVVTLPSGGRYKRSAWVDLSAEADGKPYRILDLTALRAVGREH